MVILQAECPRWPMAEVWAFPTGTAVGSPSSGPRECSNNSSDTPKTLARPQSISAQTKEIQAPHFLTELWPAEEMEALIHVKPQELVKELRRELTADAGVRTLFLGKGGLRARAARTGKPASFLGRFSCAF